MSERGQTAARLARGILDAETEGRGADPSTGVPCAEALAYLHGKIQPMVGDAGFETLVGRGLMQAGRRHPELGRIELPEQGPPSSEQFDRVLADLPEEERAEASTALLEEVLGFLARLVGWSFVVTLMRDRWPEVATRQTDAARRSILDDS